jgi:hypothetical protein
LIAARTAGLDRDRDVFADLAELLRDAIHAREDGVFAFFEGAAHGGKTLALGIQRLHGRPPLLGSTP